MSSPTSTYENMSFWEGHIFILVFSTDVTKK